MRMRCVYALVRSGGLAVALSGCAMAMAPPTQPMAQQVPAAAVLRHAEEEAYAAGFADGKRAQLLHDRKLAANAASQTPAAVKAVGAATPVATATMAAPAAATAPTSAAAGAPAVAATITPPLSSYSSVGPAKALGSAAPF